MAKHESEKPAISLEDAVKASQEANNVHPKTQSPLDLAAIDSMTADQLRNVIRTVAGAAGWVELGLLSSEHVKASTRLRLADIALRNKDDKIALQAIQQLLDRLEGKPVQSIDLTQKIGIVEIVLEAGKRRKLSEDSSGLLLEADKVI